MDDHENPVERYERWKRARRIGRWLKLRRFVKRNLTVIGLVAAGIVVCILAPWLIERNGEILAGNWITPFDFCLVAPLLMFTVGLFLYLLPTVIAVSRGHHNSLAIGAVNILLGWVLVGWVIALVWALTRVKGGALPLLPEVNVASGSGKYRVTGIDRESGLDVVEYVHAETEANARAKGELHGIVVTDVAAEAT